MAKPNPGKLKDQAAKYLKKGKLDKALETYQELEAVSADDLRIPQKIAELMLRLGQQARAVEKYRESARKYQERGFLVQAIAIYKVIMDIDPNDEQAKKELAELVEKRSGPVIPMGKSARAAKAAKASALSQSAPEPETEEAPPDEAEIPEPDQDAVAMGGDDDLEEMPTGGDDDLDAVAMGGDEDAILDIPLDDEEAGGEDLGEFEADDDAVPLDDGVSEVCDQPEPVDTGVVALDDEGDLPPRGPEETPLFSDLAPGEFQRVFDMLASRVVERGTSVVCQGDDGDAIYIIARGKLRVTLSAGKGKAKEVAVLGPGDFFGEIGYFYGKRMATVTAATKCLLLEMSKADLDRVVEEFPRVKEVMVKFYRERVLENLLADSPVFGALSDEERSRFQDKFVYRQYDAGEVIVKEGDPGDSIFLIKSGEVTVTTVHAVSGETMELARLKGGDFFGEVSLIKNKPRTATITAIGKTEVMELSRRDFQKIAGSHPEIGKTLEKTIERRVEQTIKKMMESMDD